MLELVTENDEVLKGYDSVGKLVTPTARHTSDAYAAASVKRISICQEWCNRIIHTCSLGWRTCALNARSVLVEKCCVPANTACISSWAAAEVADACLSARRKIGNVWNLGAQCRCCCRRCGRITWVGWWRLRRRCQGLYRGGRNDSIGCVRDGLNDSGTWKRLAFVRFMSVNGRRLCLPGKDTVETAVVPISYQHLHVTH